MTKNDLNRALSELDALHRALSKFFVQVEHERLMRSDEFNSDEFGSNVKASGSESDPLQEANTLPFAGWTGGRPTIIEARASEINDLIVEAAFERTFEKVLDKNVTLDLPQGRIAFYDDGMTVCVRLPVGKNILAALELLGVDTLATAGVDALASAKVIHFGHEHDASFSLRASTQYPGFLEIDDLTIDQLELFVASHLADPERFGITWDF